jgi:hypothetical protein
MTIAGGTLQIAGITVVFLELAIIRSHAFGVPTPWARFAGWIRRVLRRRRVIELSSISLSAEVSTGAHLTVRPGLVASDATDAERIARLERYVACIDRDLDGLHHTIDRKAAQVFADAQRHDEKLRHEIEVREKQRRDALRPSLMRQAIGGVCVFVGLVLATLGAVL